MHEDDVEHIAKRLRAYSEPISRYSDSELANHVENVQAITIGQMLHEPNGEKMFEQAFSAVQDEHVLIIQMTAALVLLSKEVDMLFVNTEEGKWIHTILEHDDNYQKPDGLSCPIGVYKSSSCPHRPHLAVMRDQYPTEYLFGNGYWELRDMYKVWEFKVAIARQDRGKAYSYALHLSRNDFVNTYHVILGDCKAFYIVEARGGVIICCTRGEWSTGGSKRILRKTLMHKNPWSRLLAALCSQLVVAVVGYLGQGRCGRCFRVKCADGSERALKVVLTLLDTDGLMQSCTQVEFERLVSLRNSANVVNVDEKSLCRVYENESILGLGFLMCDIGSPLCPEQCKTRETLTKLIISLNALHQEGYCHGDSRFHNAVDVSGRIVWLDFFHSFSEYNFKMMLVDMKLLIKSIYGDQKLNDASLCSKLEAYDPYNNVHLLIIEELLSL